MTAESEHLNEGVIITVGGGQSFEFHNDYIQLCKSIPIGLNPIGLCLLVSGRFNLIIEIRSICHKTTQNGHGPTADQLSAGSERWLEPIPMGRIHYSKIYNIPQLDGYHIVPTRRSPRVRSSFENIK